MKKYVIAAVLSLGLGVCFSGQALAQDTTPPVITAAVNGTLGDNGWYTSNVSVSWTVTDPDSQLTKTKGCNSVTRTTDTPTSGVTYTCRATSSGGTSTNSVTIKRDATQPKITLARPKAGITYKLNQVVKTNYTCVDSNSRMATCIGSVANGMAIDTASAGTKSFSVTATDNAGNSATNAVNYTVEGSGTNDTTPPVVTPVVTGTLGSNGWYTSNVGISWTVTDPESPITKKTGCTTVSRTTDTPTSGVTYTCKATSGGGTSTNSVTIKRDATAPGITVAKPKAGTTYSLNQSVKASYTCTDTKSRLATCVGTVANGTAIDTTSEGSKSFSVTATDNAGNSATKTVNYTVGASTARDTTPPVVTPVVTGTLGSNGWYTSTVGVSWTVADPQSAISSTSGCNAATVSNDTAGVTFTCTAKSSGGTTAKSVTIKRDATPPIPTIVRPGNGANYTQGQALTASYSCSDATSGSATCTGTAANGAALNTTSSGTKSFSVTATDRAGNTATATATYTVGTATVSGAKLFAWNDLGMHCADSDFSVFTLLPPFNDLNAQLLVNGQLVNTMSSYTLTYESTPDPTGSINTVSHTKTNFWDFVQPLFGVSLAPDVGLTGNPMASLQPAPMAWNNTYNWFEATGIPITPIDDNLQANYYPMVKVTALDSNGQPIVSSNTVLPISSEINCNTCHASNTGSSAAEPAAGWVNLTAGSEEDWRMNILRLHDEKNAANASYAGLLTQKGYGTSLESSVLNGKPVLCDGCHNSNALAVWGINGEPGVSNLTAAMHSHHANVSLPGSTQTLDSIGTRDACYNCHPGRNTQCLRGAMGNPVDTNGNHLMECQSCHGSMLTVGNMARSGWFDMPKCQSCHHDGMRETVAINADGTFKTWTDTRFASNADTPEAGTSLYRFSTGHGNMQCEACHNSTHAEFTDKPSSNGNQVNDNLRAISAQGYAAAIRECTVCHTTMPSSVNGGPHGMHTIGQSWVNMHHSNSTFSTEPKTTCFYCHGSTSSGSPLAVIKVAKTFSVDDNRTKTFAAGDRVTCWSCHNGPNP
jgi:hypothetical protein